MRLLELTGKGDIRLTGDEIANSPPYAILSHTWGPDHEEVTFQDMNQGKEKKKVGFAKLRFCGEQAAKDGLRYFWVDTCCIDKSSSAELSESINSMFRYYKQASKCYVYLADVPKTSFEKSRWWTRGWTLQELVAPPEVDFSSTKQKLGTKSTLERRITQVSGIPAAALRGTPMSEFSVGEKMGWAAKRNTKRPEDGAYCLFGMFDVSMPMIYGEGADQAFTRLNYEIERRLNPNPGFVPGRGPPPSSEGSRYNCFGELRTQGSRYFSAVLGCKECDWGIGIAHGASEFKPPVRVSGRDVPHKTIHQRFHYKLRKWRCFICRDGREFDMAQLKDHLERNHTYAEICN